MPKPSLRHRLKMANDNTARIHALLCMVLTQEGQINITDKTIKDTIAERPLFEQVAVSDGLLLRVVRRNQC